MLTGLAMLGISTPANRAWCQRVSKHQKIPGKWVPYKLCVIEFFPSGCL